MSPADRPRVVIVGGGFAGLSAAAGLAKAPVDVVLIDRRNYHLFQPLLYQVATAGLAPSQIAAPIRAILRRQRNATVLMEKVIGVDRAAREVVTEDRRIAFDFLILATGARHAYFGHDEWEPFAPGLKKIEDATLIRRQILLAFEQAESLADPAERQRLLSFVVIGGGPTGVEMAGAIAELARMALARDFRNIDPGAARISLVEAGPRILPGFAETLSASAQRQLERLGVEVLTGRPVTACDAGGVTVGGTDRIESASVIWAAGVAASPAAKWLNAERDGAGRVKVGPDLTLPGDPDIFVIGDTARVLSDSGAPVPGVAPAAKQMGHYAAKVIQSRLTQASPPRPFRYRDYGNLATIGRKAAVAEFGRLRLSGFPAWLVWCFAHIYFLIGFRNRLGVILDWAWAYVTYDRGARLITGPSP
ncbi:MAG TPA: NAD(P)/FAD-dependent oxidoreductase [Sphingomicrobium sp.]